MKKLVIVIGLGIAALSASANTTLSTLNTTVSTVMEDEWTKSETGTWTGKDMVWYKLDKSGALWMSKDGTSWEKSTEGTWQDKDGKWLKIGEKKLWWSTDGKAWQEVPEWKWQGSDGKWYKFDKDWTVWVSKG